MDSETKPDPFIKVATAARDILKQGPYRRYAAVFTEDGVMYDVVFEIHRPKGEEE